MTKEDFWRVEIDIEIGMGLTKTFVPLLCISEEEAREIYEMFCRCMVENAVVRLYAPGRLVKTSYRVTRDSHLCY